MHISIPWSFGLIALVLAAGSFLLSPRSAHAAALEGQKILIVYFSKTNNTRTVAQQIQTLTGGDILELKTVQQYPDDHNATVDIAIRERRTDARPELATVFPENIEDYDIIFVGYPVWEYTMPMAFFTFFDKYKFAGKTIVPFSTHLGSRLAGGPQDIVALCPQATILEGLAIRGPNASSAGKDVQKWLQQLGVTEKK